MHARDNQRQRLYNAENVAHLAATGSHYRQTIPNAELQPFVDAVLARRAVVNRWPGKTITVKLGRSSAHTDYYGTEITLGVTMRNEWVVLHEIAHCLTPISAAHHGPEYVGVLLFLAKTVLGKDAHDTLSEQFRRHKVKRSSSAVPKPIDSTEKRLREELAAAREAYNAASHRKAVAQQALRDYRASKRSVVKAA